MWAYWRLKLRSASRKGWEWSAYAETGTLAKVEASAEGGDSRPCAVGAACSENMVGTGRQRRGWKAHGEMKDPGR